MTAAAYRRLAARLAGAVAFDEPLAAYTTFRIGGPAAVLVHPVSLNDAQQAIRFCHQEGIRWLPLGLGSNVLIADRGFDGVVIHMGKGMDRVQEQEEGVWRVEAGFPTPRLARRTAKSGLMGAQRLIGVPGTVGGGVAMNAGAHGQEFSQFTRSVELLEPDGTRAERPGRDVAWRYRGSGLEGHLVVAATLQFEPGDPAELLGDLGSYIKRRRAGTPFDQPCCGSVFRNPPADGTTPGPTAGQLIDQVGLKGYRIGGAQVSEKHANYIVNVGGASARDVTAVIEAIRARVYRECGVELQLEVQVIE